MKLGIKIGKMLFLSLTLVRQTEKRDIIITRSNSGVIDKGKGDAGEQGDL